MARYISFDPTADFSGNTADTTLYLPLDSNTNDASSTVTVTANGNAATQTSTKKMGTGALQLDGNGDYLELPQGTLPSGQSKFTVEGWGYTTGSGDQDIITNAHNGDSNRTFVLMHRSDPTFLCIFREADNTQRELQITGTPGGWSTNAWYHFAVTLDGSSNLRVFINGTVAGTLANFDNGLKAETGTLRIGARTSTSNEYTGFLDDIRIRSGACSYTTAFTPPTAALGLTVGGSGYKSIFDLRRQYTERKADNWPTV